MRGDFDYSKRSALYAPHLWLKVKSPLVLLLQSLVLNMMHNFFKRDACCVRGVRLTLSAAYAAEKGSTLVGLFVFFGDACDNW